MIVQKSELSNISRLNVWGFMRRSSLIKLCVLVLGLSVTNLTAGVKARVGVDDGYYYNNSDYDDEYYYEQPGVEVNVAPVWVGPGWYSGYYFNTWGDYDRWNRSNRGHDWNRHGGDHGRDRDHGKGGGHGDRHRGGGHGGGHR